MRHYSETKRRSVDQQLWLLTFNSLIFYWNFWKKTFDTEMKDEKHPIQIIIKYYIWDCTFFLFIDVDIWKIPRCFGACWECIDTRCGASSASFCLSMDFQQKIQKIHMFEMKPEWFSIIILVTHVIICFLYLFENWKGNHQVNSEVCGEVD